MTTIEKIAALLRKAEDSPYKGERDTFLAKVNELLIRHDLQMADLVFESTEVAATKITVQEFGYSVNSAEIKDWKRSLMSSIALFTNVQSFLKGSYTGLFVGRQSDIDIACDLYHSVAGQVQVACAESVVQAKVNGLVGKPKRGFMVEVVHPRTWQVNFYRGAVLGIHEKIVHLLADRQEVTGTALVVQTEAMIAQWVKDQWGKVKSRPAQKYSTDFTPGLGEGYEAGKKVSLVKGIPDGC